MRGKFSGVSGDDMDSLEFRAHFARVAHGFDRVIGVIDQSAVATADLAHLKVQHDTRGLTRPMFLVSTVV